MKIKFLGTAAAEGIPALFCNCPCCEKSRMLGGKNIRTRFQVMLNDSTLIDFPADSYYHMLKNNLNFVNIKHIYISHTHCDHFNPDQIAMRGSWYTNLRDHNMTVHGNKFVIERTKDAFYPKNDPCEARYETLKALDTSETEEFYVNVYKANHMTESDEPLFYSFTEKATGKKFLCAHDTGIFPECNDESLTDKRFDLVSIDCTFVSWDNKVGHLGINGILEMMDRLKKIHAIDEHTKVVVNHFSHNPGSTHEDIIELVKPYGYIVAYDSMEIEI